MPPKSIKKETLVFVTNIGITTRDVVDKESSFLDKAKFVMKCVIEKKLFLRPKDEIGIILMGANESNNELNFENITEVGPVQVSNWKMVEDVLNLQTTDQTSNWVDALYVAFDYINRECEGMETTRILVLLTDFKEDPNIMNQYKANDIVSAVKEQQIQLLAIGQSSVDEISESSHNLSKELFLNVCREVNGQFMTFDSTIPDLRIYKKQAPRPVAWRVNLELADIKIPVAAYVKVTHDWKLPSWKLVAETDENEKVSVEQHRGLVDRHRVIHESSDTIYGHRYGGKFIPFSDADEAAMKYQSGKKCFTIYGFVNRKAVELNYWTGLGTRIVVPANKKAVGPFYSLVRAMADTNVVAIVRKVYNDNGAPRMGILLPRINVPDEPWCLVHIELTFAEDRRLIQPRLINSTVSRLSEEQVQAVDDLIDSMMLTDIEDEDTGMMDEVFKAGTVHNPAIQHTWNMLSHRALHPNDPLPSMEDFLLKLLEPSESVKEKIVPHLERIKILFPVKYVEPKKQKRFSSDLNKEKAKEQVIKPNESDLNEVTDVAYDEQRSPNELAAHQDDMDIDLDELAAEI